MPNNSDIFSNAIDLPSACRSAMEHTRMINELDKEDMEERFSCARLSAEAEDSIRSLEEELSRKLDRQISLVAYEKIGD